MCSKLRVLILCTSLALVSQVRAQFAEVVGPPQAAQSTSIRVTPHYDYLGNSFISGREKWLKPEGGLSNGSVPVHSKEFSSNVTPTGLHWEAGAHHPTLEFKISDQGTIHLHVARHGTTASAAWSF
jgi:hypothetical protein